MFSCSVIEREMDRLNPKDYDDDLSITPLDDGEEDQFEGEEGEGDFEDGEFEDDGLEGE